MGYIESLVALLSIVLIRFLIFRLVLRRFIKAGFHFDRKKLIRRIVDFFALLLFVVILIGIWKVKGVQIFTYLASVFTVLGVAFFAQWSLLSNITSGIILYFNHPIRLGDHIVIVDKDIPLEGKVEDITYFFLHIRDDEGQLFIISNTQMIQKIAKIRYQENDENEVV